ncbi:MAG: DUF2156 domain-containing protein [Clostridia bacterium]|nr:DUF2156 domain-containing protein [Clostridia bacterium]
MKTAALTDLPLLRRYFEDEKERLSTASPALLMMWRDYFRLSLREVGDTLLLRLAYDGIHEGYLYPRGADPEGAVRLLAEEARAEGHGLRFVCLSDRERDAVLSLLPAGEVTSDRGEADYLYRTEELATLAGRRYGGQRNHVNRFDRLYPDHSLSPLTEADVPELLPFLDRFAERHAERPLLREELDMTREVLKNYKAYGMEGVVLRAEGRVAAFAVGEVVGDTLSVHIEKADTTVAGSYQKIVQGFAARKDPAAVPYLNREDDMNDEGLRRSKLSYHPVALLEKWCVTVAL